MTKLVNRAKMTTATTGTGTITLGSAVDGYQTFADAGVVNSDVVRYVIEDGASWEIGTGTYTNGTLTRTVTESSNADAAINLSGEAIVYVSVSADEMLQQADIGVTIQGYNANTVVDSSYVHTDNNYTTTEKNKLAGIEAGATADQTGSEIKTLYEAQANTNAYTDAEKSKLAGIEAGATGDQTASEIKTAYESNADTNAYTDAEKTKLAGIEAGATGDQTASEILTAIKTVDGSGSGLDADLLDGQQGSYYTSYTDTAIANLVDTAPTTLNTLNELAAALGDDPNFATTVTNNIATKVSKAGDTMTGNLTVPNLITAGLVDGRDVSVDGAKLDGIEAGATGDQTITAGAGLTGGGTGDVTLSHADTSTQASVNNSNGTVIQDITLDTYGHITGLASVNLDGRYYTESESDSRFVNVTGDVMTDSLTISKGNTGTEPYLQLFLENSATSAGIGLTSNTTSGRKYEIQSNPNGQFFVYDRTVGSYRFMIDTGGELYNGQATNRIFADNYHPNADKLTTARNIALTGAVTGNVNFDGSGNVSIATTATSDPTLTINGDASGSATFTNLGNATLTLTVADDSHNHVISNVDGLQTALDGKLSTSGKAADSNLLDGIDSASFLRSDANDTGSGAYTFSYGDNTYGTGTAITASFGLDTTAGAIRLQGSTTGAYGLIQGTTNNLHIDTVGGSTYLNYYDGSAVVFGSGAGSVVAVMGPDGDLWKGSADNTGSKYWHADNDGSGSGLDADTLDGNQATAFATAAQGSLADSAVQPNDNPTFGTANVTSIDFGAWTITELAGVLYFASNGTNKLKIDASGNLTVSGNVTAYGSV